MGWTTKGWAWGAVITCLTACATPSPEVDELDAITDSGTSPVANAQLVWPVEGATVAALSSTFGPRQKASENFRYDFHRGIDIPAPLGTPVRAVADGIVRLADMDPNYQDAVVQVRHYRTSTGRCGDSAEGCFYSNYLHLSGVTVREGDVVTQGQIVGYTGTGESGFPHLHFEIRDGGIYQRNAIHPLRMLPIVDAGMDVVSADAEITQENAGRSVHVTVTSPKTKVDVDSIMVRVINRTTGDVVDEREYSMTGWNKEWTHTPEEWPAPSCPLHGVHPDDAEYDPNVHMDDPHFNGASIEPAKFNAGARQYDLSVVFDGVKTPPPSDGCTLEVEVTDARGAVRTYVVEATLPLPSR